MNGTQLTITVLYSIVTVIGLAVYLFLIRSTRRGRAEGGTGAPIERLERFEPIWVLITAGVMLVLFIFTFGGIPWRGRAAADTEVQVRSLQFAFIVQPPVFRAGNIDFRVTSDDVSHGFAIFDPDKTLVTQIQAVPGVVSTLTTKLTEPGTYEIRCFEYCGVSHAQMIGRFEVTK